MLLLETTGKVTDDFCLSVKLLDFIKRCEEQYPGTKLTVDVQVQRCIGDAPINWFDLPSQDAPFANVIFQAYTQEWASPQRRNSHA